MAYTGLTSTASHTSMFKNPTNKNNVCVGVQNIFSMWQIGMSMSHGENKLTPRDSIQHASRTKNTQSHGTWNCICNSRAATRNGKTIEE